ncbi:xanthine/uracil/vitamin C permease, partial [Falsihalocynthiibacter sp. BN13B15]
FGMSLVGIIHAASLHMPDFNAVSMGYLIAAVFLYVYPIFHKEDALQNENLPMDEPQATPGE